MNGWKQAIIKGMMPGALASVASAGMLALRSKREAGSIYAGTNAISHWLWGSKAFRRDAPSWKYTLVGYGIHHASALFWGAHVRTGRRQSAGTQVGWLDHRGRRRRFVGGLLRRLYVDAATLAPRFRGTRVARLAGAGVCGVRCRARGRRPVQSSRPGGSMTSNGASTSIWHATATLAVYPPLPGDAQVDVCVIGAGIAGLTSAYLLSRKGLHVIADRRRRHRRRRDRPHHRPLLPARRMVCRP
jgi:hypothetical protein